MKIKTILPLTILALILILELLPYGAVVSYVIPEIGPMTKTCSYFSLIPYRQGNVFPLVTAILTCIMIALALVHLIKPIPLFISCKVSDIKTKALNELAILRDRFGGKGAKAAIVSAGRCNVASRHRAAQLGIAVIDRDELESGQLAHRLKVIMKVEDA